MGVSFAIEFILHFSFKFHQTHSFNRCFLQQKWLAWTTIVLLGTSQTSSSTSRSFVSHPQCRLSCTRDISFISDRVFPANCCLSCCISHPTFYVTSCNIIKRNSQGLYFYRIISLPDRFQNQLTSWQTLVSILWCLGTGGHYANVLNWSCSRLIKLFSCFILQC